MITNGEFVSRVVNGIHALDKDSHVSRRWILNIGRTKADLIQHRGGMTGRYLVTTGS